MADLLIDGVSVSKNTVTLITGTVITHITSLSKSGNASTAGFTDIWPVQPKTSVLDGGLVRDSEYSPQTNLFYSNYQAFMQNEFDYVHDQKIGMWYGSHVEVQPTPQKADSMLGATLYSFKNDWYNRIHLIPKNIALGNLLSEVTRNFEVWSAYLVPKSLDSITETGTEGLNLTRPEVEPVVFKALQSRTYQVAISTTGPANIDGAYAFAFSSEEVTLTVSGSRVTVFPYEPDWGNQIVERLEWLTTVTTSYDGTERRTRLRDVPRKIYEFDIVTNKRVHRSLDSLLMNWQFRAFAVPVWTDGSTIITDFQAGDTVITLDTRNRDFVTGGSIVFVRGTEFESSEIASFTDSSVTLERPMSSTWAVGSVAYPVRICRLPKDTSTAFITTQAGRMKVRFQVDGNNKQTPTELGQTYRTLPILIDQPVYSGKREATYEARVVELDNSISNPSYEVENPNINSTTDYIWVKKNKKEIFDLKKWLHARYGRLKTIWVPSWDEDMEVYSNSFLGSSTLNIYNMGYARHVVGKINRRDIMILYKDGTYDIRRVLSATDQGEYEELYMDAGSTKDMSPETIKLICYVELKRLTSDALEFQWITPEIARLDHKFVTVYHDV